MPLNSAISTSLRSRRIVITPIQSGSATLTHEFGQDDRQHSDKVVLDGDVRWVVYGSAMAVRR